MTLGDNDLKPERNAREMKNMHTMGKSYDWLRYKDLHGITTGRGIPFIYLQFVTEQESLFLYFLDLFNR